jgi:hypothetical protein
MVPGRIGEDPDATEEQLARMIGVDVSMIHIGQIPPPPGMR